MAIKKAGASKKGSPRKSTAKRTAGVSPTEIRRRAYELYEARGRVDGFDREDWTRAEIEILSRLQKKENA